MPRAVRGTQPAPWGPAGRAAGAASHPAERQAWRGRAAFVLPPPASRPAAGGDAVGARGRGSPVRRCRLGQSPLRPSLPGHLAAAPAGTAASRRALSLVPAGRAGEKGQRSWPGFGVGGAGLRRSGAPCPERRARSPGAAAPA